MLARELMSTPPVTVRAETDVEDALRLLDEHSITMMPVVSADAVIVGVLSEADLIRDRVLPDARSSMLPPDTSRTDDAAATVGEVMTRRAITVTAESDAADAAELMTTTGVKSLPVVDEHRRVVGVVSRRDIVHALARTDRALERDLDALFDSLGVTWLASSEHGAVTIHGPAQEKDRALALAAASTVPGVVHVRFADDAPARRRSTR